MSTEQRTRADRRAPRPSSPVSIRPLSFGPSFGFGFSAALVLAALVRTFGHAAGREGFVVEVAVCLCVALCVCVASLCLAYLLRDGKPAERQIELIDAAPVPEPQTRRIEPEPQQHIDEQESLMLRSRKFADTHGLTKREEQLAVMLVQGYSNIQIEEELGLSKNTVKTHLRHIYAKTETHSRQELTLLFDSVK